MVYLNISQAQQLSKQVHEVQFLRNRIYISLKNPKDNFSYNLNLQCIPYNIFMNMCIKEGIFDHWFLKSFTP